MYFYLQTIKYRKQTKSVDSGDSDEEKAISVSYKSLATPLPSGPRDQGATATLETETEVDKDAQAIFEKAQKINEVFTLIHLKSKFYGKI